MFSRSQGQLGIRYEPDEKCPPLLAIISALLIFVPNTISLVMLTATSCRQVIIAGGVLSELVTFLMSAPMRLDNRGWTI